MEDNTELPYFYGSLLYSVFPTITS